MKKNTDETQRAAGYYDEFSHRYDVERKSGYFGFINELEFETIALLAKNKTTLEIGCGTGLILQSTHEVSKKSIGVDISSGMVNTCLKKDLDARLIEDTKLPFHDNEFDLVYSFKVLPHIPNIRATLTEISRVTKPTGRMILEFYNPLSFKAINDWLRTRHKENPIYLRHDSLKNIQKILPDNVHIISTHGVRIFGPIAAAYTLPLIGGVFRWLDRLACDTFLKRFAGYYIVKLGFNDAS